MKQQSNETLSTVELSFDIVELLRDHDGARLSEIAESLDIPKSTAHIHLRTLLEIGLVTRQGNIYKNSLRFLKIGIARRRKVKLYHWAKENINDLADRTGELGVLAVQEKGYRVIIYKAEGEKAVYEELPLGQYAKMPNSALGNAILAYLPQDDVDKIVNAHGLEGGGPNSITNRSELEQALEETRNNGYVLNDERWAEGIRGVAAPILGNNDEVLGSISISGPKTRLQGDLFRKEFPKLIAETRNLIEIKMKHRHHNSEV